MSSAKELVSIDRAKLFGPFVEMKPGSLRRNIMNAADER